MYRDPAFWHGHTVQQFQLASDELNHKRWGGLVAFYVREIRLVDLLAVIGSFRKWKENGAIPKRRLPLGFHVDLHKVGEY